MTMDMIKKYDTFIYDSYSIEYSSEVINIKFIYEIKELKIFEHIIEIPYKNNTINQKYLEKLVFNLGMIELINYWKVTMSPNIIVKCGYLNDEQISFFKKLYFNGLGEYFYRNNIDANQETFVSFTFMGEENNETIDYVGNGNMIGVGGGKDSCVSLELLKNEESNSCFIVNPKDIHLECAKIGNCSEVIKIKRVIDSGLLELNNQGFLNGHIPFNGVLAFISYVAAYVNNKKSIILSNEASANESNIIGTNINHQYSKSYEFEQDFKEYVKKYLGEGINYFSLLRGLSEYQIGMLFAKHCEKYFSTFKSCNVGSKSNPWVWCGNCPKCLFVYALLSPFLYPDKLINIFGEDLFTKESLLDTFEELLGKKDIKPFECVGTFEEVNYAITKTIKNYDGELPYLLDYYKNHYYDESILDLDLEHYYNEENSLDNHFEDLVRRCIQDER